jgi:hypothetical protein
VATDAMRRQGVIHRTRPDNPAWDRVFFSTMIVALWAAVLYGFARTYFLAGMISAPLPNRTIHVHGAAFTLWMVLLVVQSALISAKKVAWHRRLGMAGMGLAVAMVVLGVLAATDALRRGAAPLGLDPKTFFVVPITAIAMFAVLVFFAYRARRRPATHKRLILIATIAIAAAAFGRWPIAILQAKPPLLNLVTLAFLLPIVLYDVVSLRRVQKSTIWASLFVMAVQLVRVPIGFTPAWHSFATWMAGKG